MDEPTPGNASTATDRDEDQSLLDFLANKDEPCPACGYNLRMLSKPVCPECGLALKLTVGSEEAFKRAWAITLCLHTLISGVGLFFGLLLIVNEDFRMYAIEYQDRPIQVAGWVGPIIWLLAPVVLVWQRKKFCRLSPTVQRLIVALSFVWLVLQSIATIAFVD